MKIVGLAFAVLLAGLGTAEAVDFSLKAKVQPTYTDTVNGPDDVYLRGNIEAAASGTFAGRFNYEFDGILSSERYDDLAPQNVDYVIAEASVDTTLAGFTNVLSATSVTVLGPFYSVYEGEIVDLSWSVSRSISLGHDLSLIPGFAVTRRLADTAESERVQASPSIELDFPLWKGIMAVSADYSYSDYDVGGRRDTGYGLDVSWSRRLTKTLVVGFAADLSAVDSNVPGAGYQVFEIGPRVTVNLVK